LFTPGTHDRLDAIMALPPEHHVPSTFPTPGASTRLSDDAVFDTEHFAPLKNTITMGKLLLLDGGTLNVVLGDELVSQTVIQNANSVQTYPANVDGFAANIMLQGLDGSKWLQLIDGDHAWRSDGKPRFCSADVQGNCADLDAPNATPRPAQFNGGNGQFPIWESCLLRPAFQGIFTDWENGSQNFPPLHDAPSPDTSDTAAPTSDLLVAGHIYGDIGGVTYIGPQHSLTITAQDTVFSPQQLQLEYRVYKDGTLPGGFLPLPYAGTFSIPRGAGFGLWHVDFHAADPCHAFGTPAADVFGTKSFFVVSRVSDGLQAFYPFDEGAGTTIHDFSGSGTPLDLQIANPAATVWVPGGLSVNMPTVLASADPASKLTRAVSDTNELTLEAWIQPSGADLEEPGSIVTLATDTVSRNLTLAQVPGSRPDRGRYEVRLRTSKTSRRGTAMRTPTKAFSLNLSHVVYTRDALGMARIYINGVLHDDRTISGDLSAWRDVRLALGNELNGTQPWIGTYQLVALYNRSLSPAEIQQNLQSGPAGDGNPTTIAELQTMYRFDEGNGTTVHDSAAAGTPLDLQIRDPAATMWSPSGLVISATTLLSSTVPATQLTQAISGTNEVSLEAWVRPADVHQQSLARILTLSNDAVVRNIELLQQRREERTEARYTTRLRTTETTRSGEPALQSPDDSVAPVLQYVVYTRDAIGVARMYINGVKVAEETIEGDFTTWDTSYRLVLANVLTGDRPWLGEYQHVAIYNRALSPAEIDRSFRTGV
jgi:hypothetical protein